MADTRQVGRGAGEQEELDRGFVTENELRHRHVKYGTRGFSYRPVSLPDALCSLAERQLSRSGLQSTQTTRY